MKKRNGFIFNPQKTIMELAQRIVKALIAGGFMNGWFGDRSEEFVEEEAKYLTDVFAGKCRMHINHVRSDAGNLALYTNTPKEDIDRYWRIQGDMGRTVCESIRPICRSGWFYVKVVS